MKTYRFPLRIPDPLHQRAKEEMAQRLEHDPGASMNTLIIEGLRKHLDELEAQRKAGQK